MFCLWSHTSAAASGLWSRRKGDGVTDCVIAKVSSVLLGRSFSEYGLEPINAAGDTQTAPAPVDNFPAIFCLTCERSQLLQFVNVIYVQPTNVAFYWQGFTYIMMLMVSELNKCATNGALLNIFKSIKESPSAMSKNSGIFNKIFCLNFSVFKKKVFSWIFESLSWCVMMILFRLFSHDYF